MKKILLLALLLTIAWVAYKTVTADVVVRRIEPVAEQFDLRNLPVEPLLESAESCGGELAKGAEAILPVALNGQRYLYTGVEDGRVFRIPLMDGQRCGDAAVVVDTGGRPLGMAQLANGDIVIADAFKGLLRLTPEGSLTVIVNSYGGEPMKFVDDVVADSRGNLYFSDASVHDYHHYKHDSIEGRPYGRLFKWNASTQETELLMEGLYFANGVTLSADESFLLVNESLGHSIRRYWLTGLKAGKHDLFAQGLPGFPDNIRLAPDGGFWVGLPYRRDAVSDFIQQSKWLRAFLTAMPDWVLDLNPKVGLLLKLDAQGRFQRLLSDPDTQAMFKVTHGLELDGFLYTGGLNHYELLRIPLPE